MDEPVPPTGSEIACTQPSRNDYASLTQLHTNIRSPSLHSCAIARPSIDLEVGKQEGVSSCTPSRVTASNLQDLRFSSQPLGLALDFAQSAHVGSKGVWPKLQVMMQLQPDKAVLHRQTLGQLTQGPVMTLGMEPHLGQGRHRSHRDTKQAEA
ncbi:hypothetical protein NM208_g15799 [Fusarium decemcellulare]|uniref:Uncharacterized protein n=1 Tax=Fusarium decemcellulare TaxID=57161 RepID=A0ACC1RDV5_9HYPO|nr:hypothetical protein NM208_g15799 [Fusarium decemcellulare]